MYNPVIGELWGKSKAENTIFRLDLGLWLVLGGGRYIEVEAGTVAGFVVKPSVFGVMLDKTADNFSYSAFRCFSPSSPGNPMSTVSCSSSV